MDATAAKVRLWNDTHEPDFFVPIAEGIAAAIRAQSSPTGEKTTVT